MGRSVALGRRRPSSAAAETDPRPEIARVAEEHRGDATGYGETAWHPDTRTVLYVAGDWTDTDPIEEAMLAIPGVDRFLSEAEGLPEGWWDAEVVYPDSPPRWVVDPDLAATDRIVARMAAQITAAAAPEAPVPATVAPPELAPADEDSLRAALATLERSHRATTEGVTALVASATQSRQNGNSDQIAMTALETLRAFAERPVPAAAPITVNVPKQDVHVDAPITVNVPEQAAPAAPVIHVAAAEAPVVNVTVPEQKPAEPSPVYVTLPAVNVPPAEVTVNVAAPAPAAPRTVRVDYDERGNKIYVTE